VKAHAARGQAQLSVNGSRLGPVFDEYLAPADGSYQYREIPHGEVDLPVGPAVLRYVVTGRTGTAYDLATDQIVLTPVPRITVIGTSRLGVGEQAVYTVGYEQFEPFYRQHLLWTVEQDGLVLTADQNGVVHAQQRGSAVLRVTSQLEPTVTATLVVTVG
jgi:hypothetical protein